MFTWAAQNLLSFAMVVLVVVMDCGSPTLAESNKPSVEDRQLEEILTSVTTNQLKLLNEMNSSMCTSREGELRELRLLKEAVMEQLERTKNETREELETMKNETKEHLRALEEESISEIRVQLHEMEEEAKADLQRMEGEVLTRNQEMVGRLEAMKTDVKLLQDIVFNAPRLSHKPDLANIGGNHNDSNPSLCYGSKVLYGSRGSLSPSHPDDYWYDMRCTWKVILPQGTRPAFTWQYSEIKYCSTPVACSCDWVKVGAPDLVHSSPRICGLTAPTTHPMYNITGNEFTVVFHSHGDYSYHRGFVLHYVAARYP